LKSALIYASSHGRTASVVDRLLVQLNLKPEVFHIRHGAIPVDFERFELLLFVCPTYGLEELQEEMEEFFMTWQPDLRGHYFAVCELGNYYGYESFSFGALRILRDRLLALGGTEWCEPLSLDAFPRVAWPQLARWATLLNATLAAL